MRRLTPAELDRTLVDLLGVQAGKALAVLPPEQVGGFSNNVDVRTVGADTVSAIAHLASEVALEVTAEPGALLDCPTLFGDVELGAEAEAGETDTGLLMESHVELRSEGYVESVIEIAHGGEYGIEWRLYGTSCAGEGAEWTLWVDGDPVADGLAPAVWSWVGAVHALDAGSHQIRVSFDNDCYLPGTGEDRNLLVDAVRLSGRGLAIGSPDEFSDCVQTWLETFLVRAWRRPVEDPEILSGLVSLFESASAEWGEIAAVRMLIEVILQSPRFLYRVEDSVLGASPGEVVHLDGYEVASRLSYFLWGSMPDDTLLADAASGALQQPDGLQAAAERMLADPRAMEVVELFFSEWFALDHIGHVEKDLDVYPAWTEHRRASFREETIRFIRAVWEEGARFDELLTADWTIADAELADFYGLESNSDDWGRVERDPAHHAGLLTQGSFLAARARSYASSPIHRGLFIRGTLLCHVMSGPDPSLEIEVPDPDPEATTRELLEQHRSDPVCASCHDLIDPPGLAFEHFDGIGQFRLYENGHPVDASVDLTGTDVNGQFDGAAELGLALADSTMVQTCFAQQWFRFAHGRRPSDGDDCEIAETAQTFIADDLDMQSLVLATVASPAFRTAVGSP
ncbi:MAG: DUF1592 domain-containing protein [Myxococcota bacterium]|nr:DUF1592 domain-containing protein [Myxococcota bacterium]